MAKGSGGSSGRLAGIEMRAWRRGIATESGGGKTTINWGNRITTYNSVGRVIENKKLVLYTSPYGNQWRVTQSEYEKLTRG